MARPENSLLHNPVIYDCILIAGTVIFCALPFTLGLGFYADDWVFLSRIAASPDHSFWGLYRAIAARGEVFRPVEVICEEFCYWLFGRDPLGYHILCVGLLVLVGVWLYLVARQFVASRPLALSIALIFSFLPNYSTDRFWSGTLQITLSTALYFVSLYLFLKALETEGLQMWLLLGAGLFCLVGSILAYEVILPLFLLNLLLLTHRHNVLKKRSPRPTARFNLALVLGGTSAGVFLCGVFKFMTTIRYHPSHHPVSLYVSMAKEAIKVHFIYYGAGLPSIDLCLVHNYPRLLAWCLGVAIGIFTFWYLHKVMARVPEPLPGLRGTMILVGCGLLIFGAGYSIFWFTPSQVGFSTTGLNNRTAEVASIGVAMALVGGASLFSILGITDKIRNNIFCLVISFVVFSGTMINNYIASFWIEASREQHAVLETVQQKFRVFPMGDTLLIDGFCPYLGPGTVFEGYKDMSAALRIAYKDPTVDADVITRAVRVRDNFLSTSWYSTPRPYAYGKDLIVFNIRQGIFRRLTDANATRSYFRKFNPDGGNGCPSGRWGYGVPLFYFPDEDMVTQGGPSYGPTELTEQLSPPSDVPLALQQLWY